MINTSPESAGFSSRKLSCLTPILHSYVDQGKIPGIIFMVARRGKIAYAEAYGEIDIANHQPLPMDAIFRLASQTKPITATATMILYEDGAFDIQDPIANFLPEFTETQVYAGAEGGQARLVELERPITIQDLLTYQTGIGPMMGGYPMDPELETIYQKAALGTPQDDLASHVSKLATLPLYHQPGKRWTYGSDMDVLARLIEVVSGLSFSGFLQQRIFNPLGMDDTGFFVPPEKAGRLARAYTYSDTGALLDLGEEEQAKCLEMPRLTSGTGNLLSTAPDYLRFSQLLANGGQIDGVRILGRKTIEFMAANRLPPDQLPFYPFADTSLTGYGFGFGVRVLLDPAQIGIPATTGEFGWAGYYGTGVWIDPAEQLSGVFMSQVGPGVEFWPHCPSLDLRRIVYQAIED